MKLKTVDYTCILDSALASAVQEHEDEFVKSQSGEYVWAGSFAKRARCLENKIRQLVESLASECKKNGDMLVVLSSCFPKDNVLMSLESSMPAKLKSFISDHPDMKWLLREKGINVDMSLVNETADKVFKKLARESLREKEETGHASRVLVSHRCLDAYALEKIVSWAYGSSVCSRMLGESSKHLKALVPVNKILGESLKHKDALNRSQRLKDAAAEVRDYMDSMLGIDRRGA